MILTIESPNGVECESVPDDPILIGKVIAQVAIEMGIDPLILVVTVSRQSEIAA